MTITEKRHAKAVAKLAQAESDMKRAFKKWSKLLDTVKRYERRMDKELAERHSQIGGELDIRDIAKPTKPELLAPVRTYTGAGSPGRTRG